MNSRVAFNRQLYEKDNDDDDDDDNDDCLTSGSVLGRQRGVT